MREMSPWRGHFVHTTEEGKIKQREKLKNIVDCTETATSIKERRVCVPFGFIWYGLVPMPYGKKNISVLHRERYSEQKTHSLTA
jgi:hypothetical protein